MVATNASGAARLAARAALRIGSGLVSVCCSDESFPVYASSLDAVMVKPLVQWHQWLDDERVRPASLAPVLVSTNKQKHMLSKRCKQGAI